jgi:RNA polymerase sigma-70 factor (ECF subfamily)
MQNDDADRFLVKRIRAGETDAWAECIARFEGRLLAFVDSRLRHRPTSEDVVQETFLGFLVGLPNYNDQTPLESFLFSIAAHKLTDVLRRNGRRPTVPLFGSSAAPVSGEPPARGRAASSLARSKEDHAAKEQFLRGALGQLVAQWLAREEFERLKCIELLLVRGWPNKDVAAALGISEQAVANHKHFVVSRLKEAARKAALGEASLQDFGLA